MLAVIIVEEYDNFATCHNEEPPIPPLQVLHMIMGLERLDRIISFTEEASQVRPSPFQQPSLQQTSAPASVGHSLAQNSANGKVA